MNRIKTVVLLAGLGGLMVFIGSLFGTSGVVIGAIAGLALCGGSYWFSDRIALRAARAVPADERQFPTYYGIMRDLTRRAGTPMPRLYVTPDAQPNAFATGRNPQNAAVAVTAGLLEVCDADELRGVLAHELSHVTNRDILIASVAAAVATAISAIANLAMWTTAFGGDDRDSPHPVALLLGALVAPLAATLLQLAISRSREFEADRRAAELLGDPRPLARALAKLDALSKQVPMHVQPAQASNYIVNPLTGSERFASLFATHPPMAERIARLVGSGAHLASSR